MSKRDARREREVVSAREAIVEAAISVFAEHGYHGAAVEQLASAAGYSVGSLYNYFAGKQQIYQHALQKIGREVQEAIEVDLPESVGFFEALIWSVKRHFAAMTPYRRFFQTAFEERASFDLGLGAVVVAIQDSLGQVWLDRVTAMVERGQQRGEVRSGAPEIIAWMITGVLSSLFHVWVLGRVDEDIEPALRASVVFLAEGLHAPQESP
jgi:AcrR family transcriptional regulator